MRHSFRCLSGDRIFCTLRRHARLLAFVVVCATFLPLQALADEAKPAGPYLVGRLLIAADGLQDPRFQQSVILILEHDRSGAFGVILNHLIGEGPLGSLIEGFGLNPDRVDEAEMSRAVRLHSGGPVEPDTATIVHSTDYKAASSIDVGGGLAWTLDSSVLDAAAAGRGPEKMLVFIGYAGWAPGQLEREFGRDDWLDASAGSEFVFDTPAADMYDAVQDSAGLSL